ncbi:unnamed protein product [Pleuronectes platessa]|uniref:Uncharacterized protein n=1 Tax=Pleuronectes platessa TaxID=8262 RepID=A0A9N7ULR2_PLEPL|nr:unnamed protein product [Pleuronectes platessa]
MASDTSSRHRRRMRRMMIPFIITIIIIITITNTQKPHRSRASTRAKMFLKASPRCGYTSGHNEKALAATAVAAGTGWREGLVPWRGTRAAKLQHQEQTEQ